jgi:hypothetical protein
MKLENERMLLSIMNKLISGNKVLSGNNATTTSHRDETEEEFYLADGV